MAKFRVSRPGWIWLLMVAVLTGIGLFRHINLLMLLVCPLFAVWCMNALLAGWRLSRLRGKRRIDSPAFAQTEFKVEVAVTNLSRSSRAAVRIEDGGPSHALAWFAAKLPGRQTTTFRQSLTLPNRGRYPWGALCAWSSYPFGLVRRSVPLAAPEEITVLPRLGRLHRGRLRQFLARQTAATEPVRRAPRHRLATEAEFHGLRAFRHGDSPRWIHWRTTARRGELMVREFEDAPGEHLILVVDLCLPPERAWSADRGARHASVEDAISFAATVCWQWCRQQGNQFVLGVAGKKPAVSHGITGNAHALRMLECLAVQEAEDSGNDTDMLDQLAALPLPPAPVLLVSAHGNRLGDSLARGLNRPVVSIEAARLADLDFYERSETGA